MKYWNAINCCIGIYYTNNGLIIANWSSFWINCLPFSDSKINPEYILGADQRYQLEVRDGFDAFRVSWYKQVSNAQITLRLLAVFSSVWSSPQQWHIPDYSSHSLELHLAWSEGPDHWPLCLPGAICFFTLHLNTSVPHLWIWGEK